jgi:hypothetical protein
MKFRVLWDVLQCSEVYVDRCFRGMYCFHHQGDHSSADIIRTIKTLRMRRAENVACMDKMKNTCRVSAEGLTGRDHSDDPGVSGKTTLNVCEGIRFGGCKLDSSGSR